MSDFQSIDVKASARIGVLSNPVQDYAWGSKTAIQDLLGKPGAADKPMAELWMGAHPRAPSNVIVEGEWKALNDIIEKEPESLLGKEVAGKFSNKLPFLFKVLAAAKPLSIQVHPALQQARKGFVRENRLGIPLEAPNRNYKDDNHKPEIICGLTSFQGLKGFRKIEESLDLMKKLSPVSLTNELRDLKESHDTKGLRQFFTALITMGKEKQRRVVTEAVNLAEKVISEDPAFRWMVELNSTYPGDIGVLSPLYLNLVLLNPGEALYLPAGELHAYLEGVGIELMASSDNVLRGGLTPKHVDVPELLEVVNFNMENVRKIAPVKKGICEKIYPTPAEEFLLSVISTKQEVSFTSPRNRSVEILICTKGEAGIKDLGTGELVTLSKGKSVIIPATVAQYRVDGEAIFYKASVPF